MNNSGMAWNFSFEETAGGIQLTSKGNIALCDLQSAVRQSIVMIVSTTPGERIMRPEYGCELQKIIFLPNDFSTAGLAKYYLEKALSRWEKRIRIIHIDAEADSRQPELMMIRLFYEIISLGTSDEISFSINLTGDTSNAD